MIQSQQKGTFSSPQQFLFLQQQAFLSAYVQYFRIFFYPFSIPLLTFRRNIFFSFSNSLSICFVSTYYTRIFCLYFQWKTNIRICLQVCAKVGNSGGENV